MFSAEHLDAWIVYAVAGLFCAETMRLVALAVKMEGQDTPPALTAIFMALAFVLWPIALLALCLYINRENHKNARRDNIRNAMKRSLERNKNRGPWG